jgi:DtxR family transcriptional regulator, Mn-dependent transcriptional regulator
MEKPLGQSREDYLERILMLRQRGKVRITDLARELGVAKSSAAGAVQKLAEDGYLHHDRYGDIQLTARGSEVASEVLGRHQMLKYFIQHVLRAPEEIAEADACAIEHHLSAVTLESLARYVSHFKHQRLAQDAFEAPVAEPVGVELQDIPPGGVARIVGYRGENPDYRQKLLSMGLFKGQVLTVVRRAPLGDPVQINVDGGSISLRLHEARELMLQPM